MQTFLEVANISGSIYTHQCVQCIFVNLFGFANVPGRISTLYNFSAVHLILVCEPFLDLRTFLGGNGLILTSVQCNCCANLLLDSGGGGGGGGITARRKRKSSLLRPLPPLFPGSRSQKGGGGGA